jgi:hypothetical protein
LGEAGEARGSDAARSPLGATSEQGRATNRPERLLAKVEDALGARKFCGA